MMISAKMPSATPIQMDAVLIAKAAAMLEMAMANRVNPTPYVDGNVGTPADL